MKRTLLAAFAILAILLTACGTSSSSGSSSGTPGIPATGNGAKVTISNYTFDPAVINVKVGQTVTWTNEDVVPHTVVADDNSFQSSSLGTGATFSFTFTKAGTFSYHCSIHPKMKAKVEVTP